MRGGGPRVAYQGEPGAFSEEAVLALFGGRAEPVPRPSFEEVGRAVLEGYARYGLLPVENTAMGSIAAAYDVLVAGELRIVGEVARPVRHALVGLPGAVAANVRRVLSHPAALAQCTRFLAARPELEAVAVHDTAGAARTVAESDDTTLAALASRAAAERYGLRVLADGVQDRTDNQTRFFLVAAPGGEPEEARAGEVRTVLVAETENRPGALAALLGAFAEHGVNLTRLESRPGARPWTYRFFLELQGDASAARPAAALEAARGRARSLSVLGSFSGEHPGAAGRPPAGLRSAGIVGLGLIGGSLARELAARGVRVLGWDRDPATLRAALEAGVVAGSLADMPAGVAGREPLELPGLEDVEAVLLAVPAEAAAELLGREAARLRRRLLVLDVASTKRAVVARAAELGLTTFVGAHPLAGSERAGWGASRLGLFAGAPVYLCPHAGAEEEAVERAAAFWRELGGRPERLEAAAHDARLAWTSHLPQLASSALGLALAAAGVGREALGRGGHDATRLAGSDAELWTEIALDNADLVVPALGALEARLTGLRQALEAGDGAMVRGRLDAAAAWAGLTSG